MVKYCQGDKPIPVRKQKALTNGCRSTGLLESNFKRCQRCALVLACACVWGVCVLSACVHAAAACITDVVDSVQMCVLCVSVPLCSM